MTWSFSRYPSCVSFACTPQQAQQYPYTYGLSICPDYVLLLMPPCLRSLGGPFASEIHGPGVGCRRALPFLVYSRALVPCPEVLIAGRLNRPHGREAIIVDRHLHGPHPSLGNSSASLVFPRCEVCLQIDDGDIVRTENYNLGTIVGKPYLPRNY